MSIGDVRTFDRFARAYDLVLPGAKRSALEDALSYSDRPVDRLLDVGGGPGRASRAVAADERIVVDASRGMIRQARRHGLAGIHADGAQLPVRDASVDAVLVTDALHHMADQRGVIRAAARALRPGGVLVVRDFDPATLRGRALVAAERLVGFKSTFLQPNALTELVTAAGLVPRVLETGFGYTVVGVKPSERS